MLYWITVNPTSISDGNISMQLVIDEWIFLLLYTGSLFKKSVDFNLIDSKINNLSSLVPYDYKSFNFKLQERIDYLIKREDILKISDEEKNILVLSDKGKEKAQNIYDSLSDSQKRNLKDILDNDKDKLFIKILKFLYEKNPSFIVLS